jgi:hypothetical protein
MAALILSVLRFIGVLFFGSSVGSLFARVIRERGEVSGRQWFGAWESRKESV